jgi:uncharacterized RDD family membrane protein YckC
MANPTFPVPADRIRVNWFGAMPEWLDRPGHFRGLARRRVAAYLVDLLVLLPIGFAVKIAFAILATLSFGLLAPLLFPALGAVPLAYHTLTIGGPRSSTWGMRLFDVEMRSWTGDRPDYFQALLAALLFYASLAFTGGLILLLGIFNRRRRLAHDLCAGMVAVRSSALNSAEAIPPGAGAGMRAHA